MKSNRICDIWIHKSLKIEQNLDRQIDQLNDMVVINIPG
jgi:hypothetical protein